MPFYNFLNNTTGEEFEELMSFSERDNFLNENPHITQCLSAPALGDSILLGLRKPDSSFRDILKNIKKKHNKGISRSTINTF